MCLAIPAKVISIDKDSEMAMVSLDGIKKEISVSLLQEVKVGDYVLIHVGYALNIISDEEAKKTLAIMKEAGLSQGV